MAKFKKCLFPLHNHIFRTYHWIYELFFTDLARFQHDFLFKKSSNINEVTRAILNSFIQNFHNHKQAQNAYRQIKIKKAPKKTSKGKIVTYSLICVFVLLPECLCVV